MSDIVPTEISKNEIDPVTKKEIADLQQEVNLIAAEVKSRSIKKKLFNFSYLTFSIFAGLTLLSITLVSITYSPTTNSNQSYFDYFKVTIKDFLTNTINVPALKLIDYKSRCLVYSDQHGTYFRNPNKDQEFFVKFKECEPTGNISYEVGYRPEPKKIVYSEKFQRLCANKIDLKDMEGLNCELVYAKWEELNN